MFDDDRRLVSCVPVWHLSLHAPPLCVRSDAETMMKSFMPVSRQVISTNVFHAYIFLALLFLFLFRCCAFLLPEASGMFDRMMSDEHLNRFCRYVTTVVCLLSRYLLQTPAEHLTQTLRQFCCKSGVLLLMLDDTRSVSRSTVESSLETFCSTVW